MKNFTKKGFTLVEVLIVIIIVGILIAALLPRLTGSQQRARNTARAAAVNQVANGVALLISEDGALTGTLPGTGCASTTTTTQAGNDTLDDYLATIPADPNNSIHGGCSAGSWPYVVTADGKSVFVYAETEGTDQGNATGTFLTVQTDTGFAASLATDGDYYGAYVSG